MLKKLALLLPLLLSSYAYAGNTNAGDASFEVKIDLPSKSGQYHNPYVAIWIEDSTGQSVRTLALWREREKWLKDIRRWWRKVGRKDEALVDAVTSATRAAGQYSLTFNGLDDKGNPIANGDYFLRVEVVREKGGRTISKQAISLDGQAHAYPLAATAELNKSMFKIKY